jgi:hypothetical protein
MREVPSCSERALELLLTRRSVLSALGLVLLGTRADAAEEPAVPPRIQVELLTKVVAYDRNFVSRANGRVRIFILTKSRRSESVRVAAQMQSALSSLATVANLPHEERIVEYTGAGPLAEVCKSQHPTIVIVTPGFADDISSLRAALTGADVLTVSCVADYVQYGVVLGFDLVSSKPKMLLNLLQARRQHVAFSPDVLRLMRVYEQ